MLAAPAVPIIVNSSISCIGWTSHEKMMGSHTSSAVAAVLLSVATSVTTSLRIAVMAGSTSVKASGRLLMAVSSLACTRSKRDWSIAPHGQPASQPLLAERQHVCLHVSTRQLSLSDVL